MKSLLFRTKNFITTTKNLDTIKIKKYNYNYIYNYNHSKFRFCIKEKINESSKKDEDNNQEQENSTNKIENLDKNLPSPIPDFEEKTRNEEVIFCIMHDKFSVKPNKEYRISHTTKEKTDNINKLKDLDVIYYELRRKVFPRDYPYSVKNGYTIFSYNQFMSNVIYNASAFITVQLLINSMGLGISKTTTAVFSAGMNWAIKEGIGQVGAILIATNFTHRIISDAKNFRFFWVFGVNISLWIECSSLLYPQYFLFLATTANFIKLTSLSSSNLSRTIILNHFAKQSNISDITNKYSIQQNIAIFIGNLLGFIISLVIPHTFTYTFSLITCLSVLNLHISYKSLKYIELNEFNFQRAVIFSKEFVFTEGKVKLSPSEICAKEKVFFYTMKNIKFCKISPEIILKSDKTGFIIRLIDIFKDKNYIVYVKKRDILGFFGINRFEVFTFLKVNADNEDIFLAFLLSVKINILLKEWRGRLSYKDVSKLIEKANLWVDELNEEELFSAMKKSGWNLNFSPLEENFMRYQMLIKSV